MWKVANIEVRYPREKLTGYLRDSGSYSVPGLLLVGAMVLLFAYGEVSPHGYFSLLLYLPLAAVGALAAALPAFAQWRTAPVAVLVIATVLMVIAVGVAILFLSIFLG
jgi:hypothetical protein